MSLGHGSDSTNDIHTANSDDVDVHERHRPGERGDSVRDTQLQSRRPLRVLEDDGMVRRWDTAVDADSSGQRSSLFQSVSTPQHNPLSVRHRFRLRQGRTLPRRTIRGRRACAAALSSHNMPGGYRSQGREGIGDECRTFCGALSEQEVAGIGHDVTDSVGVREPRIRASTGGTTGSFAPLSTSVGALMRCGHGRLVHPVTAYSWLR